MKRERESAAASGLGRYGDVFGRFRGALSRLMLYIRAGLYIFLYVFEDLFPFFMVMKNSHKYSGLEKHRRKIGRAVI